MSKPENENKGWRVLGVEGREKQRKIGRVLFYSPLNKPFYLVYCQIIGIPFGSFRFTLSGEGGPSWPSEN
jgi:hypothetical protein